MRVLGPKEDPRPRVELCSWCSRPATVALYYETQLRRAACDLDGIHPRVLGDEQTGGLVITEPIVARAPAPRPYLVEPSGRLKLLRTEPATDPSLASSVAREALVLVDEARRVCREATMDLRQGRATLDDYAAARQRLVEIRDASSQQEARQVELYVDLLDEEWLDMTAGPAAAEEHWRTRSHRPSSDQTLPGLGPEGSR